MSAKAADVDFVMKNDDKLDPDKDADGLKCECTPRGVGHWLKNNVLLILLISSLGLGIGLGAAMRSLDPPLSPRDIMYFKFPGDVLMRMLKCLIIPLVVSSLIAGLAGLDAKSSGKLGLYAVLYYFSTTLIAVLLGILLVSTIRPGYRQGDVEAGDRSAEEANVADAFLDLIRNMLPDNIVEACFRQTKTHQVPRYEWENRTGDPCNTTDVIDWGNGYCNVSVRHLDAAVGKEFGMNVLGLVVYSVAMGVVVSRMGELGKPIYHLCNAIAEATMKLVVVVIWYSPIGITFLIAAEIITMKDPVGELAALGFYMLTVLSGLFIHGFIILPLIYLAITRKNPLRYLAGITEAMVTAFGTASSSATLPVTYKCLEQNLNIDPRVTRFLLPVGATINMDGTALYEAVAAIFIAQSNGLRLSPADIVATSITATLASIGAASVPQAGLVTLVIVLTALGLPAEESAKILAIDWLLDRFRTAINVEGDSIGAGIVAHLGREHLRETAAGSELGPTDGTPPSPGVVVPAVVVSDTRANGNVNKAYEMNSPEKHEYEQQSTGF